MRIILCSMCGLFGEIRGISVVGVIKGVTKMGMMDRLRNVGGGSHRIGERENGSIMHNVTRYKN